MLDARRPAIIAVLTVLPAAQAAVGATLTVRADGSSRYSTIQAAIDAAQDGDEVVVGPGTYTGPGNRDLDSHGKDITVRSEQGAATTIIDCEQAGRGFNFEEQETKACVVDGFTIVNGFSSFGGGISCGPYSNPTIRNCVVTACATTTAGEGGGIYITVSSPTLEGCTIRECTAGSGGGIVGSYVDATLLNCTIQGNRAVSGWGGGISFDAFSRLTATACVIIGNEAQSGGGISLVAGMMESTDASVFTECTIRDNHAVLTGGGVVATFFGAYTTVGPTFDHCIFRYNTAGDYGGGLAIAQYEIQGNAPAGPATLRNCTLSLNSALKGAAVDVSAGDLVLHESIVEQNSPLGGDGGAIRCVGAYMTMEDCTIDRNRSLQGYAGGIHSEDSELSVSGSSFTGNYASQGAGAMRCVGNGEVTLQGTTFYRNSGGAAGAIMIAGGDSDDERQGQTTMTDCVLRENHAGTGSSMNRASMAIHNTRVVIDRCLFTCLPTAPSAGISADLADLVIKNTSFLFNHGDSGGGLHLSSCDATLLNCRFSGNRATEGGALCDEGSMLRAINCTFAGNFALDQGGGAVIRSLDASFENCIFWENDSRSGVEIVVGGDPYCGYYYRECLPWKCAISHSIVRCGASRILTQEGATLTWDASNLDSNPRFIQPGHWDDNGTPTIISDEVWVDGDYRLRSESPCIDAGDDAVDADPSTPEVAPLPETDIGGRTRLVDIPGKPSLPGANPGIVDMGAYEYALSDAADENNLPVDSSEPTCPAPSEPLATRCFSSFTAPCAPVTAWMLTTTAVCILGLHGLGFSRKPRSPDR